MLTKIAQSNLSDVNKVGVALIRGWDAIDTENFAYLRQSAGRGKYGLPKYHLLVFVNPPATFEELLQAYSNFDTVYSAVRAWTLDEAIDVANKRLPKLLKRANKEQKCKEEE
jgi:hypothetical protein